MEIVVVDNNSTDGTADFAISHWKRLGSTIPLRAIHAREQGLSHARVEGIWSAKYETVILCDDDNWLRSDYAAIACEIFEGNPDAAAVGGVSSPEFEDGSVPPEWFQDCCGAYAVGGCENETVLAETRTCWGAGMALRRSAFLSLLDSGFSFLSPDRCGTKLSSGGDTEICMALAWMGWRIYRDSRLKFHHFIPRERLDPGYLMRLARGFGAESIVGDSTRIHSAQSQWARNSIRCNVHYAISRAAFNVALFAMSMFFRGNRSHLPSRMKLNAHIGRLQALLSRRKSYRRELLQRVDWMNRNFWTHRTRPNEYCPDELKFG